MPTRAVRRYYGKCDYVDEHGTKVWAMPTGWWAAPLLRVGPHSCPSPGSLFRRDARSSESGPCAQISAGPSTSTS
jgi:hypothetical protein